MALAEGGDVEAVAVVVFGVDSDAAAAVFESESRRERLVAKVLFRFEKAFGDSFVFVAAEGAGAVDEKTAIGY